MPLAEPFLAEIGRAFGRPPAGVSREARERLLEYFWPGSVRELRNALERAAILCDGGLIQAEHLSLSGPRPRAIGGPSHVPQVQASDASVRTAADLAEFEREMVERAR